MHSGRGWISFSPQSVFHAVNPGFGFVQTVNRRSNDYPKSFAQCVVNLKKEKVYANTVKRPLLQVRLSDRMDISEDPYGPQSIESNITRM